MSFPFLEKESLTTIMGWAFTALRVWNCQKSGPARTIAEGLPREAAKYITSNFLPEYKSFDIIKGYRADDSYFSYANDFVSRQTAMNIMPAISEEIVRQEQNTKRLLHTLSLPMRYMLLT